MSRIGVADDFFEADGREILNYTQAQAAAGKWFQEQADHRHFENTGEVTRRGPYTVANAMEDYLADALRRGVKGHKIMTLTANAHIIPALGAIEVAKLGKKKIEDWLHALAEAPRRRTGKAKREGESIEYLEAPGTEDEKRARRDTANRILTNLRAALNLARKNGLVNCTPVWQDAARFKNVSAARVRFLSVQEQRRLVNVCPAGFKELVQAALFTGCRYGELCRLRVLDVDAQSGTVFIEKSKSGKARHVTLTHEGIDWFKSQVIGKSSTAILLIRPNAKGIERKGAVDPFAWGEHDQKKAMAKACQDAGLEPIGFHELRHSYASALINNGCHLAYVAEQLGHVDTSMVEKHYGHLCPTAKAEAIRKLAPRLGIAETSNIAELEIKQA